MVKLTKCLNLCLAPHLLKISFTNSITKIFFAFLKQSIFYIMPDKRLNIFCFETDMQVSQGMSLWTLLKNEYM